MFPTPTATERVPVLARWCFPARSNAGMLNDPASHPAASMAARAFQPWAMARCAEQASRVLSPAMCVIGPLRSPVDGRRLVTTFHSQNIEPDFGNRRYFTPSTVPTIQCANGKRILRMKLPPCTDTLRLDFFTNPDFNVAKLMPSESQALGSVLVTGASGFVGSAIAAEFRRSGYAVRVLVRASSSRVNIDPRDAGRGRRPARPGLGRGGASTARAISFMPRPTTGSGRPPPTISCAPMSKAPGS